MPTDIVIPPLPVLPEPHTNAQEECYIERLADFFEAVQLCYKTGGGTAAIQACINTAHDHMMAGIGICDTL